jgi:hypothetical protein
MIKMQEKKTIHFSESFYICNGKFYLITIGMKDEYTFVTLDNDMLTTGDAVFVDVDDSMNPDMDFVQIDEAYSADIQMDGLMDDSSDFIIMDDVEMIHDFDIDTYSSDISEADVSIIL